MQNILAIGCVFTILSVTSSTERFDFQQFVGDIKQGDVGINSKSTFANKLFLFPSREDDTVAKYHTGEQRL